MPFVTFPREWASVQGGRRREHLGLAEYVGVLIMVALVSVTASLGLAWLGRRAARRSPSSRLDTPPDPAENSPRPAEPAMGVGFFLSAVAFLVFQAAGLVLVPFALSFTGLGSEGLVQGAFFVLPLAVGFAYLWRKGALGR